MIFSKVFRSTTAQKTHNLTFPLKENMVSGTTVTVFFLKNGKKYMSSMTLPLNVNIKDYVS